MKHTVRLIADPKRDQIITPGSPSAPRKLAPSLALSEAERKKALTRTYEETRMGLTLRPETIPVIVSESGIQTKRFESRSKMDSWLKANDERLVARGLDTPEERLLLDSGRRPKAIVRVLDGAVQIEPVRFPCPKCGDGGAVAGEISVDAGNPCPECGAMPERRVLANPLVCKKCQHIWIPT